MLTNDKCLARCKVSQSLYIQLPTDIDHSRQVARRIPFEDPQTLMYVRMAYISAQVLALAVYYYMLSVVNKKNDTKVLKYSDPAPAFVSLAMFMPCCAY